jgi:NADH-quinone oxidoreductase subunit J
MVGAIVIARRRVWRSVEAESEMLIAPATPIDDNPHSIPVVGTLNPRQKAYPET